MAMYMGDKRVTPYRGDGKPVDVYRNGHKLTGWREETKAGSDLLFKDTYNDKLGLLVQGRSKQPQDYYREVASAGVIQVAQHKEAVLRGARVDTVTQQVVTVQGKNLLPNIQFAIGYALAVPFAPNNAEPYRSFRMPRALGAGTYTISISGDVGGRLFDYETGDLLTAASVSKLPLTFTLTKATIVFGYFRNFSGPDGPWTFGASTAASQMQIEAGSTATPFAAFVPNSPSPDYSAPIAPAIPLGGSGKVSRTRKNLFNTQAWYNWLRTITTTYVAKETVDGVSCIRYQPPITYNKDWIWLNKFATNTQYTISFRAKGIVGTGVSTGFYFLYTDGTGAGVYQYVANSSEWHNYAWTSVAGKTIQSIRMGYNYGQGCYFDENSLQLEVGTSATEYEPFGSDTTLTPQAAMYGLPGAPDSIGADGAEKHPSKFIIFTGNEGWAMIGSTVYISYADMTALTPYLMTHYKVYNSDENSMPDQSATYKRGEGKSIWVKDSINAPNVATWKAYLAARYAAGDPVKALYQSTSPTTYTNPAQQITLADGANNVFSDVGTLTISYQVSDGQNVAGDIASPKPAYPAIIIPSQGTLYSENADASRQASMDTGILRAIPNGTGGWQARDSETIEWVGGARHRIVTRRVGRYIFTGADSYGWGKNADSADGLYVSFYQSKVYFNAVQDQQSRQLCNKLPFALWTPPDGNYWWNASASMGMRVHKSYLEAYGYTALMTAAQKVTCLNSLLAYWYAKGDPLIVDYALAIPTTTDLGPVDLPTYYRRTRVRAAGDYLPDVQATCKVVDVA